MNILGNQNVGIIIGLILGFLFLSRLKKKPKWQDLAEKYDNKALWYALCTFVYIVCVIGMMFVSGIIRMNAEFEQEIKAGKVYLEGKKVQSTSEMYSYVLNGLFMSQEERKSDKKNK